MIHMFQSIFENIQNWFSNLMDTIFMVINFVFSVFDQLITIIRRVPDAITVIGSLLSVIPVPYVATIVFCINVSVVCFIIGRTHD